MSSDCPPPPPVEDEDEDDEPLFPSWLQAVLATRSSSPNLRGARARRPAPPNAKEPGVADASMPVPSSLIPPHSPPSSPPIAPRAHTSSGGHPASHRELTLASRLELSLRLGIGLGPLAPRRPLRSLLASPLPPRSASQPRL